MFNEALRGGSFLLQARNAPDLVDTVHGAVFTAWTYRVADKSLARPTSRYILFDGENISFVASLVIYIYIYK
jgi:hypothetical protein